MALLVAESAIGPLVSNLVSLLQNEFSSVWGIQEDVNKLTSTLSTIQAVLDDAEQKQINCEPIALWLRKLKDATYDAEDILDEWLTKRPQQDLDFTNNSCISRVSHFVSTCHNFGLFGSRDIAKQIKNILCRFNDIAVERINFHLNTNDALESRPQIVTTSRSEPHVYGREKDRQKITAMLLDNVGGSQRVLSICTILGMGGLGKTTLAKSVYNDERVVNGFERRFWVCVSDPFDVKSILKTIIEVSEMKKPDLENLEAIQIKVGQILGGKRYLLVLDNVWNGNQSKWDELITLLGGGANGSWIIVTTRLERVAFLTGSHLTTHHLGVLSEDDGWSLLKHHAFGDAPGEHQILVPLGKEIVKKCKGVPLAIKSLGGLLGTNISDDHWRYVRDNEIWNLEGDENMIIGALRISYNHLSPRSKQCFAYCSLFPKDHIIVKDELIYLWIANEFIESRRNEKLEKVGEDIFQELLKLSFFEDVKQDHWNRETCKMHDLMHDLACSVAVDESLLAKVCEDKPIPKSFRHLSMVGNSERSPVVVVPPLLTSKPCLRTLFCFDSINLDGLTFPSTLRVLILSNNKAIETLPPSICSLKHLRHLDLSGSWRLRSLPKGIQNLRNLQFLILSRCYSLQQLPGNNIKSLRHIKIYGCSELRGMPVWIGRFLHTSCRFVVGPPNSGWLGINELQDLNQLRGVYEIGGLENVGDAEEAKKANLRSKSYLTKLTLSWITYDNRQDLPQKRNIKEVLEALQLPPSIQVLRICSYPWETCFPQGFLRDVNFLRELHFYHCRKVVSLPEGLLQNLPSLETLVIYECDSIRSLPVMGIQGSNNSLESLTIFDCGCLTSLSEALHYLTSLQTLTVHKCTMLEFGEEDFQDLISLRTLDLDRLPKLTTLPESIQHLTMLKDLQITYCQNLRVLPEWLQYLTTLQSLKIQRCHPDLYTSYNKDSHIISHIPHIELRPEYLEVRSPPSTIFPVSK